MTPISPPAVPRPQAAITLVSLGRAVRRYLLVFLLFVVAAAAAGAGVWFFLPLPHWTGAVTYRVAAVAPGILNSSATQPLDFTSYKQQQSALLHNKVLMTNVLADPSTATLPMLSPSEIDDPAAWLVKSLQIEYPLGPEYMRLLLEGDDPVQLLTLMKALSQTYLKESRERDRGGRLERLAQLNKTFEEYDNKRREGRAKITNAMKQLNASDPLTLMYRERMLQLQLDSAQAELGRIVAAKRDNEVMAAVSGVSPGAVAPPVEVSQVKIDELVRSHPEMIELETRLANLDAETRQSKSTTRPDVVTPGDATRMRDRAKIEAELAALPDRLKLEISKKLKSGLAQDVRMKAGKYKDAVELYATYEKALEKDVTKLLAERKQLAQVSAEVKDLRDDVVTVENMANQAAAAIEAIKPELDAPMRITVWEEPGITPGIEGKRRAKYTGMATGAVLLIGLVLVQWLEYRGRRVQTAEEASQGTGLAVIGTVPYIPKGRRGDDRDLWTHLLTEAVNTTRTMILNPQAHPTAPRPRSILITSASSGEGKTSVSTHLAVSLAGAGRRVLLIDADMRRPMAHAVLGLPGGPGLSEYLVGEVEADAVVTETRVEGLSFLPAGRWHPGAAAALNTDRWQAFVRAQAAEYDFVLVDSPPVMPVADALSIARTVDAVLFAVMRDRSRISAVKEACGRLQMVGARLLGVVLSGTVVNQSYYQDKNYYRSSTVAQTAAVS